MNRRLSSRLLFGLVLLLLAGCGEYEEKTREVGYKGLAKIDHFLAARRFADEMGLKASSYSGAPTLPPPEGASLIIPAAALQSTGQLEEISQWALDGGNLIVYLTLQEEPKWQQTEIEDFQPFLDYFGFSCEEAGKIAVEEAEEPSEENFEREGEKGARIQAVYHERDEPYETDFSPVFYFEDTEYPSEDGGRAAFLYYDYGEGSFTVISSAEPFTNRSLGTAEHATLLWDLLRQGQSREVWLIHSTRVSFFSLLWSSAPQAMTLLIITIVLFVWWAARGFGPKFKRGTEPVAKLDEHLEASGAFFIKHKADSIVIEHLREGLFRKLARAVNLPFNTSRADLLAAAREKALLDGRQLAALTDPLQDKTLLNTLQTLKTLQKTL